MRPETASVVADLSYQWHDQNWLEQRRSSNPQDQPISVYEVHLGSWLHDSLENVPESGYVVQAGDKAGARFLTYRALAEQLIPYIKENWLPVLAALP